MTAVGRLFARCTLAVGCMLSIATAAHAQQFPYPPLPMQPAAGLPPLSGVRDIYRVGTNDPVFTRTHVPRQPIINGWLPGIPQLEPPPAQPPIVIVVPQRVESSHEPARETPAPPPPPPVMPTGPKTMYIIPNCYAGNVPPRAERLPAGCDIKNLRES